MDISKKKHKRMNKLFQYIREKFTRPSKDSILLKACREGNPHAVRAALKAGANPNALTFMGEYSYSPKEYETQYTGTVSITPILLAATSAQEKNEDNYYQVIDQLLRHPKIDLEHVVVGHKKEWPSEQHHADGYPSTFEEDYHYSLRQVLRQNRGVHSQVAERPADLYPMSPHISFILFDILLEREERERNIKQAFSGIVDGLVAHEKTEQEKRLLAQAADQKVASL